MSALGRIGLAAAAVALGAALGTAAFADTYFYRSSMTSPTATLAVDVEGSAGVRVNVPLSLRAVARGGGSYALSVSGALPAGVAASGGAVSGTPTATGTFPVRFVATDSRTGNAASKDVTISVAANVAVSGPTLVKARVGSTSVSAAFSAAGVAGTAEWSAATLPSGLSIDQSGLVSGTPAAAFDGAMTVTARDPSDGSSGARSVSLKALGAPAVTGTSTVAATVGTAISATSFATSNLLGTATYSATDVPAGLSFSAAGVLSGTPGAVGGYTMKVRSTDSFDGAVSPERSVTVTVSDPPSQYWRVTGGGPQTYATSNWPSCSTWLGQKCNGYSGAMNCHQNTPYRYEISCTW